MGNGWGNGGFGGGNDFPWILNGQSGINANSNGGFRDAMINDNITSVRDGIGDISTQLFSNQIADMERSFAAQTASTQGLNAIQSQLAQCLKNAIGTLAA